MELPKGYSEEEVIDTINYVLNSIASKYTFGIYDVEDIKQEGFVIAITDIMGEYNELCGPLENFMRISLNNRLKNFKRNNYIRINHNCTKCKSFNENCEKCAEYQRRQEIKKNIIDTITIDLVDITEEKNAYYEGCLLDDLEMVELNDKINRKLPVKYREDYLRLKEGLHVTKSRRQEIENIITEIVEENE